MHIDYSEETDSFQWFCAWGCFDYGYQSVGAAQEAFLGHVCRSRG